MGHSSNTNIGLLENHYHPLRKYKSTQLLGQQLVLEVSFFASTCFTIIQQLLSLEDTSIQFEDMQRSFNITRHGTVNITVDVTGVPVPTVSLKKNGTDLVSKDKYQLENGVLRFGPAGDYDSGLYSLTASNCFNTVTEMININVQCL